MRQKVAIRSDASARIGYGHFVRSLSLARMLGDSFDCNFWSLEPSDWQRRLAEDICPLHPLKESEGFDGFLEGLEGDEIVVLDNYYFSEEHQLKVKEKGCKLVCIDDLHDKHFLADLVLAPCSDSPRKWSLEPGCGIAAGPRWALIGPEFTEVAPEGTRSGAFISFGGSDPLALTLKCARKLRELYPDEEIRAVVGDGFPAQEELAAVGGISIRSNVSPAEMAALMRSSRIAVCSASGTCYEALACGCEVYAGHYVDNQQDFYGLLTRRGLIHPLGDLRSGEPDFSTPSPASRIAFGGLAKRFRSLFRGLSLEAVPYQALSPGQSREVWEERNRPEIRCRMSNPEPFSYESHCSFIEGLASHPDRMYYAFYDGGKLVGTYNFIDIKPGLGAEGGLFVVPSAQGKGYGAAMAAIMEARISRLGVRELRASVLSDNPASLRFHESLGYRITRSDGRYHYLTLAL